jgi:gamma-glutamylcysteine synthetase
VTGEYYENGSYKQIKVYPELNDLKYLRTFKFEDLTFRGTIEYRSVCCQPIKDSMTVAAFHVGLKEKLHELTKLLEEDQVIYHHGYTASELRKLFDYRQLPSFLDEDAVYGLAERILHLAEEGLMERGYGEEVLLQPLYERTATRMNPSQYLLYQKEHGTPIEQIIQAYGDLPHYEYGA